MDNMCKQFLQEGRLADQDFDNFNIPEDKDNKKKDNLVVSRQRSVLFTHESFLQREWEAKRIPLEEEAMQREDALAKSVKKNEEKKKKNEIRIENAIQKKKEREELR